MNNETEMGSFVVRVDMAVAVQKMCKVSVNKCQGLMEEEG